MLKAIIQTKNPVFWIIIHILLGFAFSLVQFFFVVWFFLFVLTSLGGLTSGSKEAQSVYLIHFITYTSSLELIGRMCKSYNYGLPWEYGKYVIFFGFLYAMLFLGNRRGIIGFLLIFLLLPSLFIHPVLEFRYNELIYNGFGPLAVSIGIIAMFKLKISKLDFRQVLKLLLYPCIVVLAYTYIRTPDLGSIEFTLGAQFQTTGGYGSNQVSTVLGIGLFVSLIFFLNKWELTGSRMLDGFLIFAFGFQGLISFSRGGMIGAILGLAVIVHFMSGASGYMKRKFNIPNVSKYAFPVIILVVTTWTIANEITGGVLLQRYSGETNSTLLGNREKDINTLTSGRLEIAKKEFEIWGDYFLFGAGLGSSKYLRFIRSNEEHYSATHVEFSRLAAEHGLLGVTYFIILLTLGMRLYKKNTNPQYQGILMALFVIAIFTTFHAAMRTYVTPLFIGLAMLNVYDANVPEETSAFAKKKKALQLA